MWRKNLSSDKTWEWDGFKKFFEEEYYDIRELQHINSTQAGFYGANMDITMQDGISEAWENLDIATTLEKYVLTHITRTTKQLEEKNNILTDQINTLTATNVCLTSNGRNQQKKGGHATTGNGYGSKFDPTGYC